MLLQMVLLNGRIVENLMLTNKLKLDHLNPHILVSKFPKLKIIWYVPQEADITAMSPPDGESDYYSYFINQFQAKIPQVTQFLASPYYASAINSTLQASILTKFVSLLPGLTFIAPQDGVGSAGYNTLTTHEFFLAFATQFIKSNVSTVLWANIETFMPTAKICDTASPSRIQSQINAVNTYVSYLINWWAYNIPGAQNIPCHY